MNHQENPTNPPEPDPAEVPTAEAPRGPRRLLRSREDRVIAGVAGGLGRYFDVDPVIVRIAFAVSVLLGGIGVVAYIAAAIFVPADDGTGAAAQRGRADGLVRVLGVTALAFVALFGFGALVGAAAFVTGLGYGLIVAAAIVTIGIVLMALSGRGGARWLIVPAVALTVGVGVAAAADLDLEGGIGEREYRPASASAIPADGYELGVGSLAIDLREIDWSPERVLELDVRVGAGEAVVAVPSDVCVVADARAGMGDVRVAGRQADGVDAELVTGAGSRATPQLRLDADVDMGAIKVVNDDEADIGTPGARGSWDDDHGIAGSLTANEEACSAP